MSGEEKPEDKVSREEFEAVNNQVGKLTEDITELKISINELYDSLEYYNQRVNALEGKSNDNTTA